MFIVVQTRSMYAMSVSCGCLLIVCQCGSGEFGYFVSLPINSDSLTKCVRGDAPNTTSEWQIGLRWMKEVPVFRQDYAR